MHYNSNINAGNTDSVTLLVTSRMAVLLTVSLSYGYPSVNAENVDKIHTENLMEAMDGAPDVSELSRGRCYVVGENGTPSTILNSE